MAMNLRKLENGTRWKANLFPFTELPQHSEWRGSKQASHQKPSTDESLTPNKARTFNTRVGKATYLSHHLPDIQHSVKTLSRSMRNPTMIAMRRLKKLTLYLLGTNDVYQDLCPAPHAATLPVPVDSDWTDDKDTRQSCSGGAVLFRGVRSAHMGTHAEHESCFERRGRVVRHWLRINRRSVSSTTLRKMAVQNTTAACVRLTERTCGVQAKRAQLERNTSS